jgi:hypothetical protein
MQSFGNATPGTACVESVMKYGIGPRAYGVNLGKSSYNGSLKYSGITHSITRVRQLTIKTMLIT